MLVFARNAFFSGLRSGNFQILAAVAVVVLLMAFLAGGFSPRSPQTVTLDIGLSGIRIILVFMSVFWIQESLGKDIERKHVIFSLSYPSPRHNYILGNALGVALLLLIALLACAILLAVVVGARGEGYEQASPVYLGLPYTATLAGMYLSILTVVAFCIWITTLSTTPLLPLLLGLGFAVITFSIGPTVAYLSAAADLDPLQQNTIGPLLTKLLYFFPDLGRLDIRQWPLYGAAPVVYDLAVAVTMVLGYISLMLLMGIRQFSRRDFA